MTSTSSTSPPREHRRAGRFSHGRPPDAAASPGDGRRSWTTLAVLVVAQFMVVLDITIVNVALPSIGKALSFSRADLQWVVTAYALCSGGLVLVGGRASDLFGRRRMFLAGLSLFTGASLASGLAPSAGVLIAARVAQGIGAAAMTPAALSILTTTYEGGQRATALSIWGAIASGAVAVGVIAGGALTSLLSWHWVFLINVPVGLVALGFSARVLPSAPPSARVSSIDPAGALTAAGGFVAIVYGLSGAPGHGWGSLRTIALLAAGVALLVAFATIERSVAEPLVAPAIWRERALISGAATILGISGILVGTFFLLSVYTQEVLRWSALHTGASLLPFVGAIAVGVHLTGRLIGTIGSRPLIMSGMALAAIGSLLFALAPDHASYVSDLLPGLVVLGFGMGLGFPATSITAMTDIREDTAGLASGITSTAHELGGALGVAILAAIAAGGSSIAAGDHAAFAAAAVGGAALVGLASTIVPSVRPAPGAAVAVH
jgi:EmrB/QacA subfamily drug resistance transporter